MYRSLNDSLISYLRVWKTLRSKLHDYGKKKWTWQFLFHVDLMQFRLLCSAPSQNCEKRLLSSSCPSVRMEQLGFHWTDFYEIWYLSIFFSKIYRENSCFINPLTPNDPYRNRTVPLTSKVAFYIFIQQIQVLNILNMVYNLRLFLFKMQFVS